MSDVVLNSGCLQGANSSAFLDSGNRWGRQDVLSQNL